MQNKKQASTAFLVLFWQQRVGKDMQQIQSAEDVFGLAVLSSTFAVGGQLNYGLIMMKVMPFCLHFLNAVMCTLG